VGVEGKDGQDSNKVPIVNGDCRDLKETPTNAQELCSMQTLNDREHDHSSNCINSSFTHNH
jgi:hypothetical protein